MKEKTWCVGKKFSTNKAFEFQFGWWEKWSHIDIEFRWSRKCDHAGLRFGLELFGFYLYAEFYDTRHWDDDKNKWHDPHYYDPETFLPSYMLDKNGKLKE